MHHTPRNLSSPLRPPPPPPPPSLTNPPIDLPTYQPTLEEYDGDAFRQLVHALCPTIYGHEVVKAGLLLALMGGVRKNVDSANRVPIRRGG